MLQLFVLSFNSLLMVRCNCNYVYTFSLWWLFSGAIAVEGSEFSGTGKPVVIGAVNCSGMETSLPDCPFETLPGTCTGGVAGIVCQGMGIQ